MIIKAKYLQKTNVVFLVIVLTILFMGCRDKSTIYFYSLDKSQCITVISEYNYRYVINGKHDNPPDTNFVKLFIKDRNSMWDNFFLCWENEKYEWDAVVENSIILELRMDTSRFNFNTELPNNDRGIPTDIKFSNDKCATYLFELKKMISNKGVLVVYK
jgi:hypothetical protein